jgi:hypothetical protein
MRRLSSSNNTIGHVFRNAYVSFAQKTRRQCTVNSIQFFQKWKPSVGLTGTYDSIHSLNLFTKVVLRNKNTTVIVQADPFESSSAITNSLNPDCLILDYDFEDDVHESADSDFFIADDYESDAESEWLDDLPDDDIFVSDKDFPIMYLSPMERARHREKQMTAETSESGT